MPRPPSTAPHCAGALFAPTRFAATLFAPVLVAAALATAAPLSAAPVRPVDDALVLATVPEGVAGSDLRRLRAGLAAEPRDLARALDFARAAIRDARERADPRRYGEVEAALAPWWSEPAPVASVRLLRAVVRQSLHDFSGAEADFDAILAATPSNGQARLSRAFLRQATGRPAAAREDCRTLPVQIGLLAAAVCHARAEALAGRARSGLERLDRALARDAAARPEVRRWAGLVAGEIAEIAGDDDEAERRYADAAGEPNAPDAPAAAAATVGPDIALLAARADLMLRTGRPGAALTLLAGRGDADALLLRRALAA
ncbi:hypothetical protein C2U72_10570, partial [Prosthecomicrobium hirschii]|uniref:hypothetical protein n=1 Tax=Prosthecodimorpha hirschii TaxID=665126 RepID=UPI0011293737